MGITVAVAPIPKKKVNARQLLAELCFYYPQYTLAAARQLPAKDVILLLKVARMKRAEDYLNMVQIAAAPHTKKGKGVKRLTNKYQKVMKDG